MDKFSASLLNDCDKHIESLIEISNAIESKEIKIIVTILKKMKALIIDEIGSVDSDNIKVIINFANYMIEVTSFINEYIWKIDSDI